MYNRIEFTFLIKTYPKILPTGIFDYFIGIKPLESYKAKIKVDKDKSDKKKKTIK
jgi:hypothetical protein